MSPATTPPPPDAPRGRPVTHTTAAALRADRRLGADSFTGHQPWLLLMLLAAGCAGRKDSNADGRDSAAEVDPCIELIAEEEVDMIPTSGDTPNLDASDEYGERWCEPGYVCYDSYILPASVADLGTFFGPLSPFALDYVAPDGTHIRSEVIDEQNIYPTGSDEGYDVLQIWSPMEPLLPSTRYEVWRQFEDSRTDEQSSCFDLTLVTSPHGSSLSLPTSSTPPTMKIRTDDPHYLFGSYIHEGSGVWPDEGGPDYAIQFGEIIDGMASVRVAATAGSVQSWCHATLDTVVAVDNNGRFQIPGVPWRGLGTGRTDPVHGSELQNLLVEPFTISGYLAPDGQNAIVTLDDVLLDYRLAGKGCDLHELESFDVKCPDGEICCMDMSTGPTITEPSPLTSIEYIAQDNCHRLCPTSADNPDCVLP